MNILQYMFDKSYRKHRWVAKNLSRFRMFPKPGRELLIKSIRNNR